MNTLERFNPLKEILSFEKEMSKLFNNYENKFGLSKNNEEYENAIWSPLTDISENKDSYQIKVDLPGLDKNDVKVSYENNVLSISGERKQESETNDNKYHRIERMYGKFYRSFTLPQHIKSDAIEAEFKNGQLLISVPKAEEAKPKQLEIKVS